MIVILPYPNNTTYPQMTADNDLHEHVNNIINYVKTVCKGPWQSEATDILQRGVRVRIGNEKDVFMLKMKYGLNIVQDE